MVSSTVHVPPSVNSKTLLLFGVGVAKDTIAVEMHVHGVLWVDWMQAG